MSADPRAGFTLIWKELNPLGTSVDKRRSACGVPSSTKVGSAPAVSVGGKIARRSGGAGVLSHSRISKQVLVHKRGVLRVDMKVPEYFGELDEIPGDHPNFNPVPIEEFGVPYKKKPQNVFKQKHKFKCHIYILLISSNPSRHQSYYIAGGGG